jgi:hypothetical protein
VFLVLFTPDKISAFLNNGPGTNFYVGDDGVIGDVNVSNTIRIPVSTR